MYQQQQGLDEELTPISRRAPLSDAEKLRKVIRELVDTERTYVEVRDTSYSFLPCHSHFALSLSLSLSLFSFWRSIFLCYVIEHKQESFFFH